MNSLDLHGIKHIEVQKLVDNFIWENMQKKINEVEIITGISDQMKDIVKQTVEDYKMECTVDPLNVGKLIIKLK
jgi:DNA-nicking Smr family endonuclease